MRRSQAKTTQKITDCQRDFKKTRQRERGQSHESTFKMKMNTTANSDKRAKFCIPSTLNIDLILWHTQFIVCAENVKSWFKSWVFPFTFQAYILPHTLNGMFVSLFKFHI